MQFLNHHPTKKIIKKNILHFEFPRVCKCVLMSEYTKILKPKTILIYNVRKKCSEIVIFRWHNILPISFFLFFLFCQVWRKKLFALAGNRTRVASVAGMHDTSTPPVHRGFVLSGHGVITIPKISWMQTLLSPFAL